MARINSQISVEVTDHGRDGEKRKITVKISAHHEAFVLSDILVREGAIKEVEQVLKIAVRNSISDYIQNGRSLVKKFATQEKESDIDGTTERQGKIKGLTYEAA